MGLIADAGVAVGLKCERSPCGLDGDASSFLFCSQEISVARFERKRYGISNAPLHLKDLLTLLFKKENVCKEWAKRHPALLHVG